jgi:hypothetical protein
VAYWVLHVDLDQFLAAVEVLRRPELAGRPVVVGGKGDPTQRAVVATASYEARRYGVRSGMPLRTAAKRCPDAVFLPADNPHYEEVSEEVMAALRDRPGVVVEVMGWDEAFVGAETDDPEALAHTRLRCSIGIGDNMLRAKLATEFAKPGSGDGVYRLTAANWAQVMFDRPTQALWGIGTKTARKLAERGITTVRELAAADPAALAAELGPALGPWYVQLGRGIGRGGHAVGAEVAQPRDDLPGEPHRLGRRPHRGGRARAPRGRRDRGSGAAGRAGGGEGPVRAVLDLHAQRHPRRAHHRRRPVRRRRPRRARAVRLPPPRAPAGGTRGVRVTGSAARHRGSSVASTPKWSLAQTPPTGWSKTRLQPATRSVGIPSSPHRTNT